MPAESYTASVHILAQPAQVFEYFTRPDALTRWMGRHAVLDPRPGGEFSLDFNQVRVRGNYLEIDPPHRLVVSWGHAGSDLLPPGTSILEVTLRPEKGGTTVHVVHRDLPERELPRHTMGWEHFLPRLVTAASGGDPGPDLWLVSPPPGAVAPAAEESG